MMARLPKGSKRWSEPQRIDHHPGESYQNPVLFQAPNGALWLIHTTQPAGQGQANAKVLVTKSADNGKTWTTPAVLFDQPGAFVRQPLVTMSNGDWMLPMYFTPSKGITKGAETNYSVIKISGDQGSRTSCGCKTGFTWPSSAADMPITSTRATRTTIARGQRLRKHSCPTIIPQFKSRN
jgi:predicted neuraminidase